VSIFSSYILAETMMMSVLSIAPKHLNYLVFQLSMQHIGIRAKSGCLGIVMMCTGGITCVWPLTVVPVTLSTIKIQVLLVSIFSSYILAETMMMSVLSIASKHLNYLVFQYFDGQYFV
jgi:hypothetical protein